ncbi:hypothetical protein [Sphingobium bisphenolivorans]|uniref:hypothetical protein n=1 Tax=Sphingobium bisphenolivorans TaxID=1335760 RepID=UPI0003A2F00A|nr:hypothetical protein [Sphingobium bisphenolivorans]
MKGLVKFAFVAGLGAVAYKSWQDWQARREEEEDLASLGRWQAVRDAGPAEQHIDEDGWDLVDEQVDESFPASDPPGNYRGVH